MIRTKGRVLFLLFLLCLLFCSCTDKTSTLEISAEDVYDVPAGEYTLQYSVSDYEIYRQQYNLSLTVRVYNENNTPLTVTNNRTVTLENEHVYTVYIRLEGMMDGKEINRQKQYTVTTAMNDLTVSFLLRDGTVSSYYKEFSVQYGTDLPITVVPETPPAYYNTTQERSGYSRTITSGQWMIQTEEGETVLTQEHLLHVTKDVLIFSSYQYDYTPVAYTVTYEENGGTEVPDTVANITALLAQPTRPTREGYVFLGWYEDETLLTPHNWRTEKYVDADMTLYARWEPDNTATATKYTYFSFTKDTDNYGNPYYVLSVRDKNKLEQDHPDVVLPNTYEGYPVREIKNGAFSSCKITSVYIPATYTLGLNRAFADCKFLTKAEFEKSNERTFLSQSVFSDCSLLSEVILSDALTDIDYLCFNECTSLVTISLPSTLVGINEKAFYFCTSLETVTLPDSVRTVGEEAFAGCTSLTAFSVGERSLLTSFAASTLNDTAVTKITLPEGMQGLTLENQNITVTYYSQEK